jgi:GNAT superfamily N-acetyltransferase
VKSSVIAFESSPSRGIAKNIGNNPERSCRRESVRIRRALDSDIDAVVAICVSSMKATLGAFLTSEQMRPWIEGGETERYVHAMLSGMLVAEDDGRLVGVTALRDDLVDLIWVAREHRGRGIGRALLNAAEEALIERGIERARLECFEPNTPAINFYERMGWSREAAYLDETVRITKVLLAKQLSRNRTGQLDVGAARIPPATRPAHREARLSNGTEPGAMPRDP